MSESQERVCVGCGGTQVTVHLERCGICHRFFCPDCAQRGAFGRKFCSPDCSRAYYLLGESDDDEDLEYDD